MNKRVRRGFLILILLVIMMVVVLAFQPMLAQEYRTRVLPLEYEDLVERYSLEFNVPASVIYAVIKCESDFDPHAVSRAGAKGLMQLMPDTFSWAAKKAAVNYTAEQIFEPEANIHIGVYYLSWLRQRFDTWKLVYAAYNAGHNRVLDWVEEGEIFAPDGSLRIPIKETANYVEKVSQYRLKYLDHYQQLKEKENEHE